MKNNLKIHRIQVANGFKVGIVSPFTDYQMSGDNINQHRLSNVQEVYARIPLFHRAFNLRCNGIKRIPFYFTESGSDEKADWIFEDSIHFKDWLYFSEASILLRGASFTLILHDKDGKPTGDLQKLNPFTMNVVRIPDPQDRTRLITAFWQTTPQGRFPKTDYWYEDEMLYMRCYNPSDDIGPGISAGAVSLQSAQLKGYFKTFATNFFENGAMPTVVLGLPENTDPEEAKKVEGWFAQRMQGLRNAWKIKTVTGEIKPVILTPELRNLALRELRDDAMQDISSAFDIPKSLLESNAANYATAQSDYKQFATYTLSGRADEYVYFLNDNLRKFGQEVRSDIQELPEMQEDEANRSLAFKNYVESGLKPQLAAKILGIDIPEEYKEEFYNVSKPAATIEPETINLPRAQTIESPGTLPAEEQNKTKVALIREDLSKWMRKSLKQFDETKNADVEFESDFISDEMSSYIHLGLKKIDNATSIKYLFRDAIKDVVLDQVKIGKYIDNRPIIMKPNIIVDMPEIKLPEINFPEGKAAIINITQPNINPPSINIIPQVDLTGLKCDIREMIISIRSGLEQVVEQSKSGMEQWRDGFNNLKKQYEIKSSEQTKEQNELFVSVIEKAIEDIQINIDKTITTQNIYTSIKNNEEKKSSFDLLGEKLDAIYTAVTKTKITTIEKDKDGRITRLVQK